MYRPEKAGVDLLFLHILIQEFGQFGSKKAHKKRNNIMTKKDDIC